MEAPTIYRLFGDKQGLLHAVATDGLERYLAGKAARAPSGDPVADLRAGWDSHVQVGRAKPAMYSLLHDEHQPGTSPAARAATEVLAGLVHRIAEAGRLRVPERRAGQLPQASGRGTTLTFLALPDAERDPQLASDAREAVLAAITTLAATSPATVAQPLFRLLSDLGVIRHCLSLTCQAR